MQLSRNLINLVFCNITGRLSGDGMQQHILNRDNLPPHGMEDLSEEYLKFPIIRSLLSLIPGGFGSASDVLIVERAQKIRARRKRTFFDELAKGAVKLTPELIENDEFLHAFSAAAHAALRARKDEKIRMFARLLINGAVNAEAKSLDDHEEMVSLLDEISFRELEALTIFEDYWESASGDNDLLKVSSFWTDFVADLNSKLNIPEDEASSFMIRISRTGLFTEIILEDLGERRQGLIGSEDWCRISVGTRQTSHPFSVHCDS
jgi:hypothetical protein